jgi:hypothetical protein
MAHGKSVSRADVLAAVIDACPGGIPGLAAAEKLTDQVLADNLGFAVHLPPGLAHLTNKQRYTTAEVVTAEERALTIARAGYGAVHDRASRDNADLGVVVTLPNLSADRGTILPIESALGYSVSQHLFLGSGQHLALEGSSDYVYLLRMTEHNVANGLPGLDPRLAMISVGGADNMPAFVALLGRRLTVSALIDGARSQARLTRIRSAAKNNGVPESAIVLCSDVSGMPTNADIEDLFTVADYLRLYNWAFGTNISPGDLPTTGEPILKKLFDLRSGQEFDHALPAHQLTNRRKEFFSSMETGTADNQPSPGAGHLT